MPGKAQPAASPQNPHPFSALSWPPPGAASPAGPGTGGDRGEKRSRRVMGRGIPPPHVGRTRVLFRDSEMHGCVQAVVFIWAFFLSTHHLSQAGSWVFTPPRAVAFPSY